MNEMKLFDDNIPRVQVTMRSKNERLAQVVRRKVEDMRVSRSKIGSALMIQHNKEMKADMKWKRKMQLMMRKDEQALAQDISNTILEHVHKQDWDGIMEAVFELICKHEAKKASGEESNHERKKHKGQTKNHEISTSNHAEQHASKHLDEARNHFFDWNELDISEQHEKRKGWKSTSHINLETISKECTMREGRWMRKQKQQHFKSMKEIRHSKILEAWKGLLMGGVQGQY